MKKISYIFPIYNEKDNIRRLFNEVSKVLETIESKYKVELVFINDGSTDRSLEDLLEIQKQDDRISIVNFSRNFGHQYAITAGIDFASGDALIIMDSDLQDPPRVSLDLIKEWENGFEVVYAQRRTRKDTLFKKLSAFIFYRTLDGLANISIPKDTGDFRLIDKKVADSLRSFREVNRFMRGLVSYVGYRQTAVQFDRDERTAGVTNYPLRKMLKLAFDGITSFSTAPLKLISQFGYFVSFLSFVGIIYALFERLFYPATVVSGWTFTIITVLFIGGIQLIMLGILGMYVGRTYMETQDRPLYIVSSIYSNKEKGKNE